MSELEKLKKEKEDITLLFEQADTNNKELREEIEALKRQLNEAEKQVNSLTARGLKLYEETLVWKASPELAAMKAEMTFQLELAKTFISSGAFNPSLTPEQAFVLIKAGEEMGMKPNEALGSLYIVKGKIEPYGKALTAFFTRAGYSISYLDETSEVVTVQVEGQDGVKKSEKVLKNDPILQRSNAMKISEQHKMRFHGLRKLLTFHFAHLIKGAGDLFTNYEEIEASKKGSRIGKINKESEENRILGQIQKALDQLSMAELKKVEAHKGISDTITEAYDNALFEILKEEARKRGNSGKEEAKKLLDKIGKKEVENE